MLVKTVLERNGALGGTRLGRNLRFSSWQIGIFVSDLKKVFQYHSSSRLTYKMTIMDFCRILSVCLARLLRETKRPIGLYMELI